MTIKREPLVASLVGAGVIVLMVVALILPKAAAVHAKQADIAKAKQQQDTLTVELEQLQDDARHAGATSRELQQLQQEVPSTADLPGIIRELNTQSVVSGVDFLTVSPGQPQVGPTGKYSIIPVGVTVTGGFWALDQFLYRLETLPRLMTVGELDITTPTASTSSSTSSSTTVSGTQLGELQVNLTASFFTSDLSAGPGSYPGPTSAAQAGVQAPTTSSTPGTTSSTTTTSGGA